MTLAVVKLCKKKTLIRPTNDAYNNCSIEFIFLFKFGLRDTKLQYILILRAISSTYTDQKLISWKIIISTSNPTIATSSQADSSSAAVRAAGTYVRVLFVLLTTNKLNIWCTPNVLLTTSINLLNLNKNNIILNIQTFSYKIN